MISGIIPRGAAQATAAVTPPDEILTEDIMAQLNKARQTVTNLQQLDEHAYFDHPMFGNINRDQTIRFLNIHTRHHLKIIKDILEE